MHVVIFIPGILGSRLSLGTEEVWPPTLAEITLGYGRVGKLVDPAVVATEVIDRVCLRPVYGPLLADLATLAGPGGTVIPFAYDWRRDIRDTAAALARRIAEAVAQGATRVSLVAHSMGGLVARLAVEDPAQAGAPWLAKVADLLLLAVPQLGAPLALARALGLEGTLGLAPDDLRMIAADPRYPALYQLLPAPGQQALWNTGRNATDPLDLYDAAVAATLGLAPANLAVAEATHRRLAAGSRPAHLRTVHLGASGHATCLRVEAAGPRLRMIAAEEAGDGTVPLWSAVPGSAQNDVTPGDHAGFFTDDRFRTTLYRLFDQHLPAVPFASDDEAPRLRLSVDAFTYAPNAEIDVLVVPLNPARRIDGTVTVRGSAATGPEAPASPPQPVRYDGPRVTALRLKLRAPTVPGQYRLVFAGSHATGPDDAPAFAVSRAV